MSRIRYLITDSSFYSSHPIRFKTRLLRAVRRHDPTFILYREKERFSRSMALWLRRRFGQRVLLHSHIDLARRFRFFGVHLPSDRLLSIPLAKRAGLFVVVSTHTIEEILLAKRLGADMATFSPIFATPGKGRPKGIKLLRKTIRRSRFPIIALGGIVGKRQIDSTLRTKAAGFASIRYFAH